MTAQSSVVDGVNLGEELLRITGLPLVEPEIEVNTKLLFPDAALGIFPEHWPHVTALAIGVAGENLNQVREPRAVIAVDNGENVRQIHHRVDCIELAHSAVNLAADPVVR